MPICPHCYSKLDEYKKCMGCGYRTLTTSRLYRVLFSLALIVIAGGASGAFSRESASYRFYEYFLENRHTGNATILEVPPPKTPIEQGSQPALSVEQLEKLRTLFEAKKFVQLNEDLISIHTSFEKNNAFEFALIQAFDVFEIPRPDYKELLDEWVDSQPDTFAPLLARAHYFFAVACESRGTDYANETSKEQFDLMRKYNRLARNDIDKALSIKKPLLPAYLILLEIHNLQGEEQKEGEVFRTATNHFPYSYLLYGAMVRANEPRWGGSYPAMNRLAVQAYKFVDKNPMLYRLTSLIYNDMAWYARQEKDFDRALELHGKALEYGENSSILRERAFTLMQKDLLQDALKDLDRCIELNKTDISSYLYRARLLSSMGEYNKAIDDILMAGRIAPGDQELEVSQRWALEYLTNSNTEFARENLQKILESSIPGKLNFYRIFAGQKSPPMNYLANGDAENNNSGWRINGSAEVVSNATNNHYFSLGNGASLSQTIYIKTENPGFALLIGRMNSEKVGDVTGLPYLWGSIKNIDENGKEKFDWLQAENMTCSARDPKDWSIGYGIFPIKKSAVSVKFELHQGERKNISQNGSAANFDDVGLFFFNTAIEAKRFAKRYLSPKSLQTDAEKHFKPRVHNKFIGSDMSSASGGSPFYPKAQSFIATADYIDKISLRMLEDCDTPWRVWITESLPHGGGGRGMIDQTDLNNKAIGFSEVQRSSAGWVDFYFSPPLDVVSGETLYLLIDSSGTSSWGPSSPWAASTPGEKPGPYKEGEGWIFVYNWNDNSNCNADVSNHIDYAFRVYE